MGAFFLAKSSGRKKIETSFLTIFKKKGFKNLKIFNLGEWKLWLFRKQLIDEPNYYRDDKNNFIFSTGTWIYKSSRSLFENMKYFLRDFVNNSINCEKLYGNYAILIWNSEAKKLTLFLDPLAIQKVFYDINHPYFSTSFLALLSSNNNSIYTLDKLSFYEKILTGYIVAPDTLVEEIKQVLPQKQNLYGLDILTCKNTSKLDYIPCNRNFEECVDIAIKGILKLFENIIDFSLNYNPELGLSSGFDSRLLLAIFNKIAPGKITVQSHLTKGVHENEFKYAKELASLLELKLKFVPTKRWSDLSCEELKEMLEDNVYYFDGRNSHNMGAFSQVYTRQYKIKTLEADRFSFNGLGGEIFRNYYFFPPWGKIDFYKWMKWSIFYPYLDFVVKDKNTFFDAVERKIKKMQERLQMNLHGKVNFITIRKYYSEIRMPDCDGVNANAHNQLAFYYLPFMEPSVIKIGYSMTNHIGLNGEFQAAMISKINPNLARVGSHYGFSFKKIPFRHKICSFLKEITPIEIRLLRRNKILLKKAKEENDKKLRIERLIDRCNIGKNVLEFLYDNFGNEFEWKYAILDESQQQATTMFIGFTLLNFSGKIKLK